VSPLDLTPNPSSGAGAPYAVLQTYKLSVHADGFPSHPVRLSEVRLLNGILYVIMKDVLSKGTKKPTCALATYMGNFGRTVESNMNGSFRVVAFDLKTGEVLNESKLEAGLQAWKALMV